LRRRPSMLVAAPMMLSGRGHRRTPSAPPVLAAAVISSTRAPVSVTPPELCEEAAPAATGAAPEAAPEQVPTSSEKAAETSDAKLLQARSIREPLPKPSPFARHARRASAPPGFGSKEGAASALPNGIGSAAPVVLDGGATGISRPNSPGSNVRAMLRDLFVSPAKRKVDVKLDRRSPMLPTMPFDFLDDSFEVPTRQDSFELTFAPHAAALAAADSFERSI